MARFKDGTVPNENEERAVLDYLRNGSMVRAYITHILGDPEAEINAGRYVTASNFFKRKYIQKYMNDLREEIKTFYTAEDYFNEINEAKECAKLNGQSSVILSCAKSKAEHAGLLKTEISTETKDKKISEQDADLLSRFGINITINTKGSE